MHSAGLLAVQEHVWSLTYTVPPGVTARPLGHVNLALTPCGESWKAAALLMPAYANT